MPYFYRGELLLFAMVRAHWIDVGGMSTGFGAGPTVADPWMEGLQLDQLKIYEAGKLNETLYRVLKDNIRFPESSLGDMKSQMAACRLAARRMDELFDKYGRDTILAAIAQIFDETEAKCRNVVAAARRRRLRGGGRARRGRRHCAASRFGSTPRSRSTGRDDHRPFRLLEGAARRHQLAHARRRPRRLQGADRPARSGQRGLVPRARGHHPGRQHHDGALPGADVDLEHDRADGGRHHRRGAGAAPCRTAFRPAITACSAARWCSSARIPRPSGASWCRASKAAAGAAGRSRTANPAPSRCARATCATARSKASSSNARCWSRAARLRTDSGGAGKYRGGLGIDMRVRNLVEGKWNFELVRRSQCPPWGLWGGKPGEYGMYLLREPGESELRAMGGAHHPVPLQRRGDRAHRRRRRLGRSARARPGSGARGRAGGTGLARERRASTTAWRCTTT